MNNNNVTPLPVEPKRIEGTESVPRVKFDRYKAAYEAAQRGITAADNIKYGSIFVAGFILVAALLIHGAIKSESSGFPIITVSLVVFGAVLVLAAQFWSLVFGTQNRLLQIAIEIAVNTSPVLTNIDRVEILRPLSGFYAVRKNKKKAA